ncbi:MAG: GNAT family N-acetyltransferase [Candidatus Bathyarchaeota archaeon]|nr:MAG: GNAT family N-acetyltransferase [Candidatus Bathyarchaeota archaeon]
MVTITQAKKRDLSEVLGLLRKVGLPVKGVDDQLHNFFVAREKSDLKGCGGLEAYGNVGLIRSVAVDPPFQGQGLGHSIVRSLEALAAEKNLSEIYLLTETAETFFAELGYVTIHRDSANPDIKRSSEFASLCPASAACMKKTLR